LFEGTKNIFDFRIATVFCSRYSKNLGAWPPGYAYARNQRLTLFLQSLELSKPAGMPTSPAEHLKSVVPNRDAIYNTQGFRGELIRFSIYH